MDPKSLLGFMGHWLVKVLVGWEFDSLLVKEEVLAEWKDKKI